MLFDKINFDGKERVIYVLDKNDSGYPYTLLACPNEPVPLYGIGNIELLKTSIVAVVGTREPTPMGEKISYSVASSMASRGMTVLSGLALGIDTHAHEGALSVAGGKTIAVMATSLRSSIYPKANDNLSKRIIAQGGLLVTTYKDEEEDFKSRLINRSLLQARMSIALVLIQSGIFNPSDRTAKPAGSRHATNEAHRLRRMIIAPNPVGKDERYHPEKYQGVREAMNFSDTCVLRGSEDYDQFVRLIELRKPHLLLEAYARKKDMGIERLSRI